MVRVDAELVGGVVAEEVGETGSWRHQIAFAGPNGEWGAVRVLGEVEAVGEDVVET